MFTVNLKGFLLQGPIRPYLTAGLGAAVVVTLLFADNNDDLADINKDPGIYFQGRLGLGVEIPVGDHFYGYVQGSWSGGTGEISNFSYFSTTAGIGLVF